MQKLADISFFESLEDSPKAGSVVFNGSSVIHNYGLDELGTRVFHMFPEGGPSIPSFLREYLKRRVERKEQKAREAEERRLDEEARLQSVSDTLEKLREVFSDTGSWTDSLFLGNLLDGDYFKFEPTDFRGDNALTDEDYQLLREFKDKAQFYEEGGWGRDTVNRDDLSIEIDSDSDEYPEYVIDYDKPEVQRLANGLKDMVAFYDSLPSGSFVRRLVSAWLSHVQNDFWEAYDPAVTDYLGKPIFGKRIFGY